MIPSRRRQRRDPVLVSAHRCLTIEQVEHALRLGVDYVEFDVQRCADGSLVLAHDPVDVAPPDATTYDEVLEVLAGRGRAHLDLKFHDGCVDAVAHAVGRLGTDRLVVTTLEDRSVTAIRAWSDVHAPALLVGLSLGRGCPASRCCGRCGCGSRSSSRGCATAIRGPTSWSRTTGWPG